jgi:hypothetical protein
LKKALYGLKQAPRAWYSKIDSFLLQLRFARSLSEATLYVKTEAQQLLIVSLYVDDLLIIGSSSKIIQAFKDQIMQQFQMTDIGLVTYFLGLEINQEDSGISISQQKYASGLLSKFNMDDCKPVASPFNFKEKLNEESGDGKADERLYRSLIGSLMYLTATRPDILFAASRLSRFMHCATQKHMQAVKRILRYVKG